MIRRFVGIVLSYIWLTTLKEKRIYIPLPELESRAQIISHLIKGRRHSITDSQLWDLAKAAEGMFPVSSIDEHQTGYSGSDLTAVCREAALQTVRDSMDRILDDTFTLSDVRSITLQDFKRAMLSVRPSVNIKTVHLLEKWNAQFGSRGS